MNAAISCGSMCAVTSTVISAGFLKRRSFARSHPKTTVSRKGMYPASRNGPEALCPSRTTASTRRTPKLCSAFSASWMSAAGNPLERYGSSTNTSVMSPRSERSCRTAYRIAPTSHAANLATSSRLEPYHNWSASRRGPARDGGTSACVMTHSGMRPSISDCASFSHAIALHYKRTSLNP